MGASSTATKLTVGLPSGSLMDATIALFAKAGYVISGSRRSYRPSVDDAELELRLLRAQEISRYVEQGFLDCGITGRDWVAENNSQVQEIVDLPYSKVTANPTRWVLVVPENSPFEKVEDLEGKRVATEAVGMTKRFFEKHGVNGHLRQKGKIAELALGYGGSVGALKAMGALDMGLEEDELPQLVDTWRQANPRIVNFWWDVDKTAMEAVRYKRTNSTHGITFSCQSGMLFITLPSGRRLAYVKPRIGENKFGGTCITYEGVGSTKKWERLDSYGPKFVENIVQATARDILCSAMQTLRNCSIVMHVHDEIVIEADPGISLKTVCEQMGRTPSWAKGLLLQADGYETDFYKKD